MTARLQNRLGDLQMTLCRCQNGSSTRQVTVETYRGGAVAHVAMYQGRATYDLIMVVDEHNTLLVHDQTCNGDPKTSIYINPVEIC